MTKHHHLASALGVTLAALHIAALWGLAQVQVEPLRVEMPTAGANDLPSAKHPRAELFVDGTRVETFDAALQTTGTHRLEWRVQYAGGFQEAVGVTRLVGPFIAPGSAVCGLDIVIKDSLLTGEKSSVAAAMRDSISAELRGFDRWPLGKFREVLAGSVTLRRTAEIKNAAFVLRNPTLLSQTSEPYIDVQLTARFEDGQVPVEVAVIPRLRDGKLHVLAYVAARVETDGRFTQLLSDVFDADDIATSETQAQLNAAVQDVASTPPTLALGNGDILALEYCPSRDIEVGPKQEYLRVPMAVRLSAAQREYGAIDVPASETMLATPAGDIAIDADGRFLNALLYDLWLRGQLDRWLDSAHLAQRFNEQPLVQALLSVRLKPPRLAMPPTLEPSLRAAEVLQLATELATQIVDKDLVTDARAFARVGLALTSRSDRMRAELGVSDLALTCVTGGAISPCYATLAGEMRRRAPELHQALSEEFGRMLNSLLHRRNIETDGSGTLQIRNPFIHADTVAQGLRVRIEAEADFAPHH